MGSDLSYNNSVSKTGSDPIVVRINRPNSIGYNPCHKDIYNAFDKSGFIPKIINIWIPICGVKKLAGLRLAPASHVISEVEIERVYAGSFLNGQNIMLTVFYAGAAIVALKLFAQKITKCQYSHPI
tara:strand:- start:49 stop:426 length:378 start_codon:yes stop_codon:yes gene_type:complete